MQFKQSSFVPGDRVMCAQFSPANRPATFVEYGPASIACPDTHVSTPGMRIAFVDNDRFGRIPVWERNLVAS